MPIFLKKLLKDKEKILKILVYFVTFLFLIFPYSDLDWGWHLKYGEHFLKTGTLLRLDIFSWTLPGYQWINHSWAYDPLMAIIYKYSGFIGLSLTGAVVSFLAFYLIVRIYRLSSFKIAILAFFFVRVSQVAVGGGLRSQVLALLFFSLLMVIIIRSQRNLKILVWLPLLFLAWANFHGTFLLGLIILFVFLASRFLAQKSKQLLIPLIFISSVGFTLLNPYFFKIYLEGLNHFNNPYLGNVKEWMPPSFECAYCNMRTLITYVIIIFVFFLKRRTKEDISFFLISIGVVFLAFSHQRYTAILAVVTLPFLASILDGIKFNFQKFKSYSSVFFLVLIVLIEFNFFNRFTVPDFLIFNQKSFCSYTRACSFALSNYINQNPPNGRGINFYDAGGYLIGADFPAKLFIDGRMHLWKKDDYSPFVDYVKIYYDQDYDLFKKYDFNWALIEIDSNLGNMFLNSSDLGNWSLMFQDNNLGYFVKK